MTGLHVLSLVVTGAIIVAVVGIIVYGAWAILTNKTFLTYMHDIFKWGE